MNDPLKKPVHLVLMNETLLQKLNLARTEVSIATPEKQPLPKEEPKNKAINYNIPKIGNVMQQTNMKIKLPIIYDKFKPEYKETPPCDTCVSVCCKAFVVGISKEEYDSGNFGEYAIKITPEIRKQFRGFSGSTLGMALPQLLEYSDETKYFLEGKIGEDCPFLENNRCGIYDIRPIVCRAYSCVGDSRITDDMRSGKDSPIQVLLGQIQGDE